MTDLGLGPEKKYKSRVPPSMRYWMREVLDPGGVASRISDPAALFNGKKFKTYHIITIKLLYLERKTP